MGFFFGPNHTIRRSGIFLLVQIVPFKNFGFPGVPKGRKYIPRDEIAFPQGIPRDAFETMDFFRFWFVTKIERKIQGWNWLEKKWDFFFGPNRTIRQKWDFFIDPKRTIKGVGDFFIGPEEVVLKARLHLDIYLRYISEIYIWDVHLSYLLAASAIADILSDVADTPSAIAEHGSAVAEVHFSYSWTQLGYSWRGVRCSWRDVSYSWGCREVAEMYVSDLYLRCTSEIYIQV